MSAFPLLVLGREIPDPLICAPGATVGPITVRLSNPTSSDEVNEKFAPSNCTVSPAIGHANGDTDALQAAAAGGSFFPNTFCKSAAFETTIVFAATTVVAAVAVLLAAFGSLSFALTVALFVIEPGEDGAVTTILE